MTYKQSNWVHIIGVVAFVLCLALAEVFQVDAIFDVGLVILVVTAGQLRFFHRCPECGRYVRPMIPEYQHCPHCGERL